MDGLGGGGALDDGMRLGRRQHGGHDPGHAQHVHSDANKGGEIRGQLKP